MKYFVIILWTLIFELFCLGCAGSEISDSKSKDGLFILEAKQPDIAKPDIPDLSGVEIINEINKKDMFSDFVDTMNDSKNDAIETSQISDFKKPCSSNADCQSGFCVNGQNGYICTQLCYQDCPAGFSCKGINSPGPDITFVCVPDFINLCAPCEIDSQCNGGICRNIGGSLFCTEKCKENSCSDGYICYDDATQGGKFCIPVSGSCSCNKKGAGTKRVCKNSNEFGTCLGYETCNPEKGWEGCTATIPAKEICNGIDDDCNGVADDGLNSEQTCEISKDNIGTCKGIKICMGEDGWKCNALTPQKEICDYIDNDCDGQTDEDFKTNNKYSNFDHCGSCFTSCASGFPHAVSKCDTTGDVPLCVVDKCDSGFVQINPFQCIPSGTKLCQECSTNEDCLVEGAICMTFADGKYCGEPCETNQNCPKGYSCSNAPQNNDDAQKVLQCIPDTQTCSCSDANIGISRTCEKTYQPEGGMVYSCQGEQICESQGWSDCQMPNEVCDGLDNNCNGEIDEPFKNQTTGYYTSDKHCGQCFKNCSIFDSSTGKGKCIVVNQEFPRCDIQCNEGYKNLDNNPENGCECKIQSSIDFPGQGDENCDGIDGEINNAVFVAKNGNDNNSGTIDSPMLTIQAALNRAKEKQKRDVYVATGVYEESIIMKQGIGLYGGYGSNFHERDVELYQTVIMGQEQSKNMPGAVNFFNIFTKNTVFSGFVIYGADGLSFGGSSYALYIKNCDSHIVIDNNSIIAGNGSNGENGSDGQNGASGASGSDGLGAYDIYPATTCDSSFYNIGGIGGKQTCSSNNVSGGNGGSAICPDFDEDDGQIKSFPYTQNHVSIEYGSNGKGISFGAGGKPGYDALIWDGAGSYCGICNQPKNSDSLFLPTAGQDGTDGKNGKNGDGGISMGNKNGQVINGLWQGWDGTDGKNGENGSGGGGGGAAGGVETINCTSYSKIKGTDIGGSGGGGGAGGCKGTGGKAGKAGGGSFGIFLIFTGSTSNIPIISNNNIITGQGGNGGQGGTGGKGGAGGYGGLAGLSGDNTITAWCADNGGHGGNGGNAGHGGGGSGGNGGVSFAIFVSGNSNASLNGYKQSGNNFDTSKKGGKGGHDGASMGNPGTKGIDGASGIFNL